MAPHRAGDYHARQKKIFHHAQAVKNGGGVLIIAVPCWSSGTRNVHTFTQFLLNVVKHSGAFFDVFEVNTARSAPAPPRR